MPRISVVQPEHKICSKCGGTGHNREECNLYENFYYKPGFLNRCSRCDQPGHNRSNNQKCSLFNQYRDKKFSEIVEIQTGRNPIRRIRRYKQETFIRMIKKMIIQIEVYSSEIRNILGNQPIFNDGVYNTLSYITYNISNIKEDINAMTLLEINMLEIQLILSETNVFLDNYQNQIMNIMLNNLSLAELNVLNNTILNSIHRFNGINSWVIIAQNIKEFYNIFNVMNKNKNIKLTKEKFDINTVVDCSICYECQTETSICVTGCNHIFCIDCITSYCKTRRVKPNIPCPMCRDNIKELKFDTETILNETLYELN